MFGLYFLWIDRSYVFFLQWIWIELLFSFVRCKIVPIRSIPISFKRGFPEEMGPFSCWRPWYLYCFHCRMIPPSQLFYLSFRDRKIDLYNWDRHPG